MPGNLSLDDLKTHTATGEIDTVIACQIDMQGRLMGKRFQAEFFVDSAWAETHSCNYLLATDLEMATVDGYAATSWASGYGDYTMRPDLTTLRRVPWLDGTALVLCDVLDHHGVLPVRHSPRAMLKHQVDRLANMGLTAMMGTELEFFTFRESYEQIHDDDYRTLTPASPYNEDYHIFQTTREEPVMRAIRNGLHGAGVPVESTKGEAEAGQGEINVRYSDALDTADNHAITKNACREIAWQNGHALTFMAKWHHDRVGSSGHLHQSLRHLDSGTAAFPDPDGMFGMSMTMRHFLAGQLLHSRALTYFLAPYINSYKRFAAGTFAPTAAIWSTDNRTAGFRICGTDTANVRIECRIGGADLNPYLAMAALIAAGIDGLKNEQELESPFTGDAYTDSGIREIPRTLRAATDALNQSEMLRAAMGDDVIDHYVRAARWEQEEFDRVVTDYEVKRGLERA